MNTAAIEGRRVKTGERLISAEGKKRENTCRMG